MYAQPRRSFSSVKGDEGNWVDMQRSTFTNWCNQHLKEREMRIQDLETDFADGTLLVNLYEAISRKSIGRYNKNPKIQTQSLENVTLVLKALEDQGIHLVSIDSEHIITGNTKLILGLIWRLILHYQIGADEGRGGVKVAVKKLLLIWLQQVIPEQNIKNLTTDWNSGIALCALVEALKPGSCPAYRSMKVENAAENVRMGMQVAEDELGVPQVLSPDYMTNPNVDELSMMTYLSYFTQDNGVGERWALQLVREWNSSLQVTNFNTDWNDGTVLCTLVETMVPGSLGREIDPKDGVENVRLGMEVAEDRLGIQKIISPEDMANPNVPEIAVMTYVLQFRKCKYQPSRAEKFVVSGIGLTEPKVGKVNEFYIRCEEDLPLEHLKAEIISQDGELVPVPVTTEITSSRLVTCRYVPPSYGTYSVKITYKGDRVPKSPAEVSTVQDVTNVKLTGAGLARMTVNEDSDFTIDVGNKLAKVEVFYEVKGENRLPATVANNNDGTYKVCYRPNGVGKYRVIVIINGVELTQVPVEVEACDPKSVYVRTQSQGGDQALFARMHEQFQLSVDARKSGVGQITAFTQGPRGCTVATNISESDDNTYSINFTPDELGEYSTTVMLNNQEILGSPFRVWVSDPTRCVAHGEGLYQCRLNETAKFEVTTMGAGPGKLEAYAESDRGRVPINISKLEDDHYSLSYYPTSLNDLRLHVKYNASPVRGSPFTVMTGDPNSVRAKFENMASVRAENECVFVVNVGLEAGHGDLNCVVSGPDGELPCTLKEVNEDTREVLFVPERAGLYQVNVYYAGAILAGCPYIVQVLEPEKPVDASMVIASGDGLHQATVDEETDLSIDGRRAGPGLLTAKLEGITLEAPVEIQDNRDGTYKLTYVPPSPGAYLLLVRWNDEHIPESPFKITVYTKSDPNQVVVEGEGIKEGTVGQPVQFTLDGRQAGPGQLSCKCMAPSGELTHVHIEDNKDGTFTIDLNAREPGLHSVEVDWDGNPVPGSPFTVRISQSPDVSKVKVYGPGLHHGILNTFEGRFTAETKGAGPGTLKIRIHGPKGAFKVEMFRENSKERKIGVRYNPTDIGLYTINCLWSDEHVSGSPFDVYVVENEEQLGKVLSGNTSDIPQPNGYPDHVN